MGKKAIIGSAISAGIGYLGSELIGDSIARAVFPLNPLSAQILDNTLKLIFTGGMALGAYQILRETERKEEKYKGLEKKVRSVKTLGYVKPVANIEKRGEEFVIGKDASGKTAEKALSNYIMKFTGGKSSVRPIPGRESYCMSDIMSGRLTKYEKFLEKRPEISNEPPLVKAAIFSRNVLHENVDVEEVRKKVLAQSEEIKKSNEK